MKCDAVVSRAAAGRIALVSVTPITRADVVANCDVVGPVIAHLGLRPSVHAILEHVELFFHLARPRGMKPLSRSLFDFGSDIKCNELYLYLYMYIYMYKLCCCCY